MYKRNKKINCNDLCKEFCKKLSKEVHNTCNIGPLVSHLSQQPTDPAYYSKDCRISGFSSSSKCLVLEREPPNGLHLHICQLKTGDKVTGLYVMHY